MDFGNLQEELFERKLKMGEYFKKSFGTLKVFIGENIQWFVFMLIANILTLFFSFCQQKLAYEINLAEQMGDTRSVMGASALNWLIMLGTIIVSLATNLVGGVIFSKIGCRIEGREYRFKNVFDKYLKYLGLYFLFLFVLGIIVIFLVIIGVLIFLVTRNAYPEFLVYLALVVPIGIYIITMVTFIMNVLYFLPIFYIRDMKISDTFKYNLSLSKKNRLRMLIPLLILILINFIFIMPFITRFFIFVPLYIVFPIAAVCGVILSITGFFIIIISTIIFLNVEYDYLKKQGEEMKKIEENI